VRSRYACRAHFELIPDAGHIANVDNPAAFTAALEHFFD
jgi:pimeloyl-ACP methyl ester carboxylesterase